MEKKPDSLANIPPATISVRLPQSVADIHSLDRRVEPYLGDGPERANWVGLSDYWRLLFRHKILILGACTAGVLLALAIGILLKPVFRANTTLEVLNINQDFMNMRPTQAALPSTDSDTVSEEETQATLLQSDLLLDRVCKKLNPNPTPLAAFATSGWRSWLHLREKTEPSEREKLLSLAVKSLKVINPPRTRILAISVDSTDSQLALDFTGMLVQEFIKENIDARWASTQQTGDWLTREIDDARAKLQNSENALQMYARTSGLLFIIDDEKQENVATEKLREIQQQLAAATTDRIAKQSVFELAKNSPPNALADVLNDLSLQALSARLDDATRQVASLRAVYNSGYAKLKQAEAEEETLRKAFESRRADLLQRIKTDYQSATVREKLLSAAYDVQAREVAGQDERAVQYNVLKREAESNRQLYDTMLQQMKQASIATALHASNVHIIDAAYLSDSPVFPNHKLNAALGFLTGLVCSVGFVFIRERADRTVRQPGEVKLWASLPELGAIPGLQADSNRTAWKLTAKAWKRQGSNGNGSVPTRVPNLLDLKDVWDKPLPVVEAFHSALTSILLTDQEPETGRILVFTSAGVADGKTSVVSNIAIAAANAGKRVLLVDADLRRPRIHELFGLNKERRGLAEILDSAANCAQWLQIVQQTQISHLNVITAGNRRLAGTQVFHSREFSTLMHKWREEYDLILVDTPPAIQITDARVIGALADGVVLVVRAGQTTREELSSLQERLTEDKIRLLGCILNDWDARQTAHTYPYYAEKTFG